MFAAPAQVYLDRAMADTAVSLDQLKTMNQAQLDEIFSQRAAGPIPSGEGEGTVLFDPGTPLEDVAARVAHALFWKGKVFDPAKGELRNLILPTGLPAIVAKVFVAPSWIEARTASCSTTRRRPSSPTGSGTRSAWSHRGCTSGS